MTSVNARMEHLLCHTRVPFRRSTYGATKCVLDVCVYYTYVYALIPAIIKTERKPATRVTRHRRDVE